MTKEEFKKSNEDIFKGLTDQQRAMVNMKMDAFKNFFFKWLFFWVIILLLVVGGAAIYLQNIIIKNETKNIKLKEENKHLKHLVFADGDKRNEVSLRRSCLKHHQMIDVNSSSNDEIDDYCATCCKTFKCDSLP